MVCVPLKLLWFITHHSESQIYPSLLIMNTKARLVQYTHLDQSLRMFSFFIFISFANAKTVSKGKSGLRHDSEVLLRDLGFLLVIVSVQRGEKPCKCFAVMQSFDNNTINYEMPKHSDALSGMSFRDKKNILR